MAFPRTGRRGSAARTLLLALLVLTALVAAALWWLKPSGGGGALEGGAAPTALRPQIETGSAQDLTVEETAVVRDAISSAAPTAGGTARLTGDGRLSGRVLERESGNGVGGVEVELLPLPPIAAEFYGRVLRLGGFGADTAQRSAPIAAAQSGSDGSFAFEGLRPGNYFVDARGPGHVIDTPLQVRVTPADADAGAEVWMRRGGRVIGLVELPDGKPAAGVGVALRPGFEELLERARSGDLVLLDARTDAQGRFVIAGVPPAEGWALAAYGGNFALSHLFPVAVRAGEDSEVTLRTRAGASLSGRTVSGSGLGVDTPHGVAVAGAHVGAVPHGLRDLTFVEHLLEQCHDVTDANGNFQLGHVPPGEVDLVAWAPGHLATIGPSLLLAEAGEHAAGDFALDGGPSVQGRVVDSAGEPVAGASVRWQPVDFSAVSFGFSIAPLLTQALEGFEFPRTDADGRFTAGAFPGDPPYEISVSKPGFADVEHDWTPDGLDDPIEIVLRRGGAVEGIVMDGGKRTPLTTFTVSSEAQLPSQSDLPTGGDPFGSGTLIEDPQGRFRVEPLEPGETVLTFTAKGFVPAHSEKLTIVEGQTLPGVIVTLQPGGTLRGRVTDDAGGAVAGALVYWAVDAQWDEGEDARYAPRDASTDQMPGGLREYAAALGLFGDATAISAPDGSFELVGVRPARVVVYASHRSLATGMSAPTLVGVGQTVEGLEIELTDGAELTGTVRDRFGRVVPGVVVLAVSPGALQTESNTASGLMYQGYTDSEGHYAIRRMAGGGYFVMTARGDAALDPLSLLGSLNLELVTVPEGEHSEYDLVDTSVGATRVTGVVHDRGEPLSAGNVVAMGLENESLLGIDIKVARIRADGTFAFEGLAAGEYRFQISEARTLAGLRLERDVRLGVEIPDQPEVHLDLALPLGEIAGVVLDAETGEPVHNATLALKALDVPQPGGLLGGMMGGDNAEREATDDKGDFAFARLEAGLYRLEAGPARWGEQRDRYAPMEPMEIRLRDGEREARIEIRLKPSLGLKGRVVGAGGEPVSGARIRATRGESDSAISANARSGEDGKFDLRGLAAGTWTLSINAGGYSAAVRPDVEVKEGANAELELVLERGTLVKVRVEDAAGKPAAGAAARLVPLDPGGAPSDPEAFFGAFFGGRNTTDSEGLLELGNFRPGAYRLEVQRGLLRAPPRDVQIDGAELELRARLP